MLGGRFFLENLGVGFPPNPPRDFYNRIQASARDTAARSGHPMPAKKIALMVTILSATLRGTIQNVIRKLKEYKLDKL